MSVRLLVNHRSFDRRIRRRKAAYGQMLRCYCSRGPRRGYGLVAASHFALMRRIAAAGLGPRPERASLCAGEGA